MKKIKNNLIVKTSCLVASLAPLALYAEQSKPNIIFIYADDMGIGDVSHTTGLAQTPHIDRMAKEGMSFTDAHSASAVCTPSRYSLMTGRYSWRTRLASVVFNKPDYLPLIEKDEPTVASLLRENGYNTAMVGKWHLGIQWQYLEDFKPTAEKKPRQGWEIDFTKPALMTPTSHGFDYFFGIAASLDMPPYLYIENETALSKEQVVKKGGRPGPMDVNFEANQCLKIFAEKSVSYIDEQAKIDKPFFLYVPLTSPHTPIVPSEDWKDKSSIGTYGDFLMETDWVVGQILNALDKHKISDNTLVLFSTDNGCSPAARLSKLEEKGHFANGNLRGNKADIYEGGHRVPFVVRWPAVVPADVVTRRLTCQTDFMSTCADILGIKLADHTGVDSVSFFPTLKDPKNAERSAIVHHSINGSFAVRKGDWKLALCSGSGGWSAPKPGAAPEGSPEVQLFNLAEDLGEKNNLQVKYPERVEELTQLLEEFVKNGRSTPGPVMKNAWDVDIGPNPRVPRTVDGK